MLAEGSGVVVVPFTQGHAGSVLDLILPIQRDEFAIPVTAEDQPDLADIVGFYQHGNGNFWVALSGRSVVGSVALLDIGNARAALRKMYVRKEFRGASYGTAKSLLDALLEWARDRRVREVYLGTTEKLLAAHRFYEKHGFVEIPKSLLPERFPVAAVDTKFYRRDLTGERTHAAGSPEAVRRYRRSRV